MGTILGKVKFSVIDGGSNQRKPGDLSHSDDSHLAPAFTEHSLKTYLDFVKTLLHETSLLPIKMHVPGSMSTWPSFITIRGD